MDSHPNSRRLQVRWTQTCRIAQHAVVCVVSKLESLPEEQRSSGQDVWLWAPEPSCKRRDRQHVSPSQCLSLSLAPVSPWSWFTIPATRILARQVLIDPKSTDEGTHSFHTRMGRCKRAHALRLRVRGATCSSCCPGGHQIEFLLVNACFAAVTGMPAA